MRARSCSLPVSMVVSMVLATVAVAGMQRPAWAEPKPAAVEIKGFRDQLVVLQDEQGGTYAVISGSDPKLFFGVGKQLYAQIVGGHSADGTTGYWSVDVFAPHVSEVRPGSIVHRADGTFAKFCGDHVVELTQRTGDKAKQILDKSTFMTTAMVRRAHMLARDDTGVYYYVDKIAPQYGGTGYRVFVGKKGAMKQLPLTDVADDTAGEVYSTKTGNLRMVHDTQAAPASPHGTAVWVRGEKHTTLVLLDIDVNAPLIYRDLGVYTFTGTLCDEL